MEKQSWLVNIVENLDDTGLENSENPITPWKLGYLSEIMDELLDESFPEPDEYLPTEDGNLQLEWLNGDDDCTLDINLESLDSLFHRFNYKTNEEAGFTVNLSKKEGWDQVLEYIGA